MRVAVAVIMDEHQQVLITKRPLTVPQGGLWEFPGGKIELNESPEEALVRELEEELGIVVQSSRFLSEVSHQYVEKQVHLFVFHVTAFSGTPRCLAGQLDMKFIDKKSLNPRDFPQANGAIFKIISSLV